MASAKMFCARLGPQSGQSQCRYDDEMVVRRLGAELLTLRRFAGVNQRQWPRISCKSCIDALQGQRSRSSAIVDIVVVVLEALGGTVVLMV